MKNKMINAGICDAREVTEESLAGFDSVQVNAGILITSPRAKELMNRYPVRLNTAMVLEVPDGHIENFYSDSLSDSPLAKLADRAWLVKKGKLSPWPEE